MNAGVSVALNTLEQVTSWRYWLQGVVVLKLQVLHRSISSLAGSKAFRGNPLFDGVGGGRERERKKRPNETQTTRAKSDLD